MSGFKSIGWFKAVVAAGLAIGLTGCGTPAPGLLTMSPQSVPISHQHQKSVFVASDSEHSPEVAQQLLLDRSIRFAPSAIAKAVQESVKSSKAFRQVFYGPGADYVLSVAMVSMKSPDWGFDMKVDLEMLWMLTEAKTNKIVFKEPVKSSYTATVSQAFDAGERHSLAMRGAVRENISAGLLAMSRLKLD